MLRAAELSAASSVAPPAELSAASSAAPPAELSAASAERSQRKVSAAPNLAGACTLTMLQHQQ